jgi:hypothetical protein
MAGCCEHGDEPSGLTNGRVFLDDLSVPSANEGLCSVNAGSSFRLTG